MTTPEILSVLKKAGKPQTAAIYKHYGTGDNVFGTLTSEIGKLQKKIKVDRRPAFWGSSITMLLHAQGPPDSRSTTALPRSVAEFASFMTTGSFRFQAFQPGVNPPFLELSHEILVVRSSPTRRRQLRSRRLAC